MAKNFTRLLSAVLAILMCASVINFGVFSFADEANGNTTTWPIDKTATPLDGNDRTDVTLTVPGIVEGYIDVVFILGGGMTANMETIESAINVFKPAMESGKATVRMGLISLEKGKEIILDLNSDEAVLDPATYVDFVTEKFDSINDLPYGTTNLHSQMLEAQKMLAKETKAKAQNKYVFVLATGRTYWFDDANGEQATIVNKVSGTYYWGNYLWQSQRGRHTSLYMIPDRYNDSYEAFFADIEKWVADDGDKYVYTPHFDVNDYNAYVVWEQANNKDLKALGVASSRFGNGIVNPKPTAENFITGVAAGASSSNHPSDALNYERAQYECVQVWKQLLASGYNCYSICSENPNYQNGSEYIKLGAKYTGTSTIQVGHAFMDYLAKLAGQGKAPVVWDYERDANGNLLSTKTVLQENFFDSVRDDMLYTTSIGTTVEDFIGKNEKGNFEFIENADYIKLVVGGVEYTTAQVETKEGADSSYTFTAPGADEATFWLDYYYGNGTTTERFVWTFGENVSMDRLASLTYKLQLTEKVEEEGTHIVPTNNSATLYPVDSDGKEGTPQLFPVPTVEYTVTPYDVDIVLALGAGIAKYDGAHSSYAHTYNSILNLVEPLVNQGIKVKLGLVAVEHYDDVAMELTLLDKDNYKKVILGGLDTIINMPAGPTNLHGNIEAAYDMLEADTAVPDANKFFYVFATGRTYNYDNEQGVPTTIINKVTLKGSTYYYWGHYLWQSQRGRHTSLYMIPDSYNNDFAAYWADVEKWVAADGDTYAYSFTEYYDPTDSGWYVGTNGFYTNNTKDAKSLKLASSRYGWILTGLTNSGLAGIGSGANPQNALNYERAQYEAYQTYKDMAAKYNCYALCTESPSYLNESLYITLGAGYKGTSNIQLGHSFMDYLAKVDGQEKSTVLFKYVFDENNNPISTDFTTANYFEGISIDTTKLVKTEKAPAKGPLMMSPAPKKPIVITSQPESVEVAIGEKFSITVVAEGEGLTYQWYYKNKSSAEFAPSSFKGKSYAMTMAEYCHMREVYCVITDANGNTVTTETAVITRPAIELAITAQPESVVAEIGEKVTITVGAVGEGLTYQWYYKNKNGTEFAASSYKGKTYSITMAEYCHMREVYCVVTDKDGNSMTTEVATMSRPAIELAITAQPESVVAEIGEKVTITVGAVGEGLTYQWYYKNKNGTEFAASSYKGKTYSITMAEYCHMREVYCVVTDKDGNSLTTEVATMSRPEIELEIISQPTSVEVAVGEKVTITVGAVGEGLTYQWYYKNKNGTAFAASSYKSKTYSITMASYCDMRQVYCVVTDKNGNTVTSEIATMSIAK